MVNTSGLKPLGRAVLVRVEEAPAPASGIVIPEAVRSREVALEQRVLVVAVGPSCWPGESPRAAPGDRVLVTRFAGFNADGKDGKKYRLINDLDIFAGLEPDYV